MAREECKENEHVWVLVSENKDQTTYRCSKCGKCIVIKND